MKLCAIIILLLSSTALAVNINDIDPGDAYYLSQLGSNEAVVVVRVDKSYSRVKIRKKDGFTEWVSPSRLLKKDENFGNEVTEGAGWVLGGLAVLCVLDEDCRNNNGNSSNTQNYSTSPTFTSGKRHEKYPNVIYANDGKLTPALGYTWRNNNEGDFSVKWKPGKKHSKHPSVIASNKEGNWHPAPGYKWVSESTSDLRVVRK